jgi:CheY-like chemotaxis protein
MTHDLKTPLQAFTFELDNLSADIKQINLSSSVLDLSEVKASAEVNIEQMKVVISFMTMAINRSLDYTKASTGVKLVPSVSPINVQESSTWVAMCLTQQRKTNVNVIVEPLPVGVCNTILTDKQWLIENLFCYLSNAQKFTTEGEIKIRFMIKSRSKISSLQGVCKGQLLPLSIHANKEMSEFDRSSGTTMLLVEVEDSGIGLSDAQKNDLFKPFKQAQSRTGGTGLGLYAMYMRVATLGGSCGVRDRADGKSGSIFWFSIPYVPEVNLEEDMVSPISVSMMKSTDEYIPPEAKFRRILVVDDSPLIQKATKRSLEREGYIVDLADNGFECLKMINSTEMIYDLILLDLNMPVMDGMETVSRIRAQEQNACCINDIGLSDDIELCQNNANVPKMANVVVGFSGNSDAETVAEARKAGMDAFLAKPLSPQDLRSLCRYMHQETFA